MKKIILTLFLVFSIIFPLIATASSTSNGKLVFQNEYATMGEKNWFVTETGTGDCSNWDRACTFRTAVTKLSDDKVDVIYLGAGGHNTDNGVDAAGTTISNDHVKIRSVGGFSLTKLYNGAASADYVLQITGNYFMIEDVTFSNGGQLDTAVTYLRIRAGPSEVDRCIFVQSGGASGTGILLDNTSTSHLIRNCRFNGIVSYGVQTNGASGINFENLWFCTCGTAINIAGETDSVITFLGGYIGNSTTGIHISGASVSLTSWSGVNFCNNTTNIIGGGVYGSSTFYDIDISYRATKIYPADAGTSINTGDGIWVWTAAPTTIIPINTVTKPFTLTAINIQSFTADQIYKLELFYGQSSATTSIGVYEFTVGSAASQFKSQITVAFSPILIPANSIIGAKLKSSTAGVDTVVISLSYKEL